MSPYIPCRDRSIAPSHAEPLGSGKSIPNGSADIAVALLAPIEAVEKDTCFAIG
jgi:hypothetical protein